MFCLEKVSAYCCQSFELIENYELCINDTKNVWDCHHRLEIQEDRLLTITELKEMGLYFNRPASELIFLTHSDHTRLHSKARVCSDNTRKKLSQLKKNNKYWLGKKHKEETKEKIRKANTNREFSDEHKQKLSIAAKNRIGEKNGMYNKYHSEESKKKMSEAKKNISEETRKKMSEAAKRRCLLRKVKKEQSC